MAEIIDGKKIADSICENIREEIEELKLSGKRLPKLVVIKIGNNPASAVYVRNKERCCQKVGMLSEVININDTNTEELCSMVKTLCDSECVDGVMIQLPIPESIDLKKVVESISPSKDVDGFHPENIGNLLLHPNDENLLRPCTPTGVIRMLESTKIDLKGMRCVIVGASNIVGKPLVLELINKGVTPILCNSKTKDISELIKDADIVIGCLGRPEYIKGSWIKKGAIVIDVGINRLESGKLVGDVEFEDAKLNAGFISPVPGGVGPMTVAMLINNTFKSYKSRIDLK